VTQAAACGRTARAAPAARGDAYDLRAAANARRRGVANLQEEEEEQLPVCDSGEAPGRWVVTHSLYSHTLGEPLTWQPYGCRWRHVSGAALDACVSALGSIKFVGESTLGQVYEYWQAHIAKRVASHEFFCSLQAVRHAHQCTKTSAMLRCGGMRCDGRSVHMTHACSSAAALMVAWDQRMGVTLPCPAMT
jgi:hypothetical protein